MLLLNYSQVAVWIIFLKDIYLYTEDNKNVIDTLEYFNNERNLYIKRIDAV